MENQPPGLVIGALHTSVKQRLQRLQGVHAKYLSWIAAANTFRPSENLHIETQPRAFHFRKKPTKIASRFPFSSSGGSIDFWARMGGNLNSTCLNFLATGPTSSDQYRSYLLTQPFLQSNVRCQQSNRIRYCVSRGIMPCNIVNE